MYQLPLKKMRYIYQASLVVQLVKNLPVMQETLVRFLGQEDPLERGSDPHSGSLCFPCGSAGKESACNVGDLGLISGWEDPLENGKPTHSTDMKRR